MFKMVKCPDADRCLSLDGKDGGDSGWEGGGDVMEALICLGVAIRKRSLNWNPYSQNLLITPWW